VCRDDARPTTHQLVHLTRRRSRSSWSDASGSVEHSPSPHGPLHIPPRRVRSRAERLLFFLVFLFCCGLCTCSSARSRNMADSLIRVRLVEKQEMEAREFDQRVTSRADAVSRDALSIRHVSTSIKSWLYHLAACLPEQMINLDSAVQVANGNNLLFFFSQLETIDDFFCSDLLAQVDDDGKPQVCQWVLLLNAHGEMSSKDIARLMMGFASWARPFATIEWERRCLSLHLYKSLTLVAIASA